MSTVPQRPLGPAARARLAMGLGAVATVAGIFVAGASPLAQTAGAERAASQQTVGGLLVVAGWVVLAWGIHWFGRAGGSSDGRDGGS
jgi:hypothetical protein